MIKDLARMALIGTGKFTDLPAETTPMAEVLDQNAVEPGLTLEGRLLLRAGMHALVVTAGRQSIQGLSAPTPAALDDSPVWSLPLVEIVRRMLEWTDESMMEWTAKTLADRRMVLPPELLSLALSAPEKIRSKIRPLLGNRGRWLEKQHPTWSKFAGPKLDDIGRTDEQTKGEPGGESALMLLLIEGVSAERTAAFAGLRESAPEKARQWLTTVLPSEKADVRAMLVSGLWVSLSIADEPMLETLLDDRSEQVRRTAARLLVRLPNSRLSARMAERSQEMLRIKAGVSKKLEFECHPPQELNGDWQRDGVPKQTPKGMGKRAFWLEHVLSTVPLDFWTSRYEVKPAELVAAVANDPFADSVAAGWVESWERQPTADWGDALFAYWSAAAEPGVKRFELAFSILERLTAKAPAQSAEAWFEPLFDSTGMPPAQWAQLAMRLAWPWSAAFSERFIAKAGPLVDRRDDHSSFWASTLVEAAVAAPESALEPLLTRRPPSPPVASPGSIAPDWQQRRTEEFLQQASDRVRTRRAIQAELSETAV